MALRIILCALACSAFCSGSPSESCSLDDDMALHQRRVSLSLEDPELVAPSKGAATKARQRVRETADGLVKRVTSALKLPTLPAMFRWELVGKVTQWTMDRYLKPKQRAVLALLDDVIELSSEVYGSKEVGTMSDEELIARLANVTRLQGIAQRYLSQTGAPPAVGRFVDALAEALQKKAAMDPRESAQLIIDVANETSGPALAGLVAYGQEVAAGKAQLDMAKVFELEAPVLTTFGAPPAVDEFLRVSANMTRRHAVPDAAAEGARLANMLAMSAQQLGMPAAFEETFAYVGGVVGNASSTHVFEHPSEMKAILAHLNGLMVKVNDQLGGPPAISQLIARNGAPLVDQSPPELNETLGLLAKASQQVGLPSAVTEFLEYIGPITKHPSDLDTQHVADLLIELTSELDGPEAIAKFGREAKAAFQKGAGKPDPVKFTHMVTQLLRKLRMPALANVIGLLAAPLAKGKTPDALVLAAVTPSLMKVLPDLKVGDELLRGMRAKLLQPILLMHENAVEKLTANMPESQAKTVLASVLRNAGPHL